MANYRIHVSKDNLMFAAGHFAVFDGDAIEPLHGHNYRFSVTIEGPVDANAYVFNFVTLKKLMKRIGDELDHRVLLPGESTLVRLEHHADGWIARAGAKWYRFPAEDVVVLPMPNTTVEMLARYLHGRLCEELRKLPQADHLTTIEVEIEETFGQSAVYRAGRAQATTDRGQE